MSTRSLSVLSALILLCPGISAAAGNLLVNGSFQTDLSGWNQPFGNPVIWAEFDFDASPASGSALVTNVDDPSSGGIPIALRQCVEVMPDRTYLFGGMIYLPAGQPQFSSGVLIVDTFAASACAGAPGTSASAFQFELGSWYSASASISTAGGVQSLMLLIGVGKDFGITVPVEAFFDNLYVRSDELFASGFESGG